MIGSLGNLMFKLHVIFVVNIIFPQAAYHTLVPSTKELYCLNRDCDRFALIDDVVSFWIGDYINLKK